MQSLWVANVQRGFDALTLLALAGQHTRSVELGTFVVPTYPRHPVALAQQALTTTAATGGRLVLGIGLSHRVVMEQGLGFDWSHPIRHMRGVPHLPDRITLRRAGDIRGRGVPHHELRHHRAGRDTAAGARRRARAADAPARRAARGRHRALDGRRALSRATTPSRRSPPPRQEAGRARAAHRRRSAGRFDGSRADAVRDEVKHRLCVVRRVTLLTAPCWIRGRGRSGGCSPDRRRGSRARGHAPLVR